MEGKCKGGGGRENVQGGREARRIGLGRKGGGSSVVRAVVAVAVVVVVVRRKDGMDGGEVCPVQ